MPIIVRCWEKSNFLCCGGELDDNRFNGIITLLMKQAQRKTKKKWRINVVLVYIVVRLYFSAFYNGAKWLYSCLRALGS
jgi:hypothetical protein